MDSSHILFMKEAIQLAQQAISTNKGGPFGAVIVKNGTIIGRGHNQVTSTNDPTAHAEIVAIREACSHLKTFHLLDCIMYTSCEPCPMCLSALYWAHIKTIYFAATADDAASIGFDDSIILQQIRSSQELRTIQSTQLLQQEAHAVFQQWVLSNDKIHY